MTQVIQGRRDVPFCPHCGGERIGKVLLGDEVEAKCLDCDSFLSPSELEV